MKNINHFGLSPRQFIELMRILDKNREFFSQVILFGSRARGDYTQTSDIDLAIEYKDDVISLSEPFENSALPFSVDIVDMKLSLRAMESGTRGRVDPGSLALLISKRRAEGARAKSVK
ncbi:nucleotidyltransferase family protein, partial [Caedibacter taeniospiralis]|uniref:nucleotidyltransferase family protein n=1 Tax=Caedibacter taeniospiralis TaxID=28907 RepID=UPI0037BF87A6